MQAIARWAAVILLVGTAVGCKAQSRLFRVTSIPPGAAIYVDGKSRDATTDVDNLAVFFEHSDYVTIHVTKDGYQPAGAVVGLESPGLISFVLQKSPEDLGEKLDKINEALNRMRGDLRNVIQEKRQ